MLHTAPSSTRPLPRASNFDATRETIESIAVAFMLAFMFKTFLAEMFVIPTGSMAPTLQGRHYDLFCPECGQEFCYGNSGNSAEPTGSPTCPNCKYVVHPDPNIKDQQVFMGDRITVNKFLYDFDAPQRWDVIVFKYPHDAKTNYIKRLIGLPGERLKIFKGDIYTTKLDPATNVPAGDESIARKPNHLKLQAMLQHVYDADHTEQGFLQRGWPSRWSDWSAQPRTDGWTISPDGRVFDVKNATQAATLRYRHFVPNQNDWNDFKNTGLPLGAAAVPKFIKDDYAYNPPALNSTNGTEWVGDLAMEFTATTTGDKGTITLDLVKGGVRFLAIIDTATGTAKLSIPTLPEYSPPDEQSAWKGAGTHKLFFANVDDQLTLLIDGEPVFSPDTTTYRPLGNNVHTSENELPKPGDEQPNDLSPLGITMRGGGLEVSHLRVLRDVYYLNMVNRGNDADGQFVIDLRDDTKNDDEDQFFMLGDNSPQSLDGRLWDPDQRFVQRRLLIGKATYIYWPHSWAPQWSVSLKRLGIDFDIPFYPNFKRMRLIR